MKNKMADEIFPITLYGNRVLYMMQQMGYDTSTGPSLCEGQGQLAPFEKVMSPLILTLYMKIKQ